MNRDQMAQGGGNGKSIEAELTPPISEGLDLASFGKTGLAATSGSNWREDEVDLPRMRFASLEALSAALDTNHAEGERTHRSAKSLDGFTAEPLGQSRPMGACPPTASGADGVPASPKLRPPKRAAADQLVQAFIDQRSDERTGAKHDDVEPTPAEGSHGLLLFHTPGGEAFATVPLKGPGDDEEHLETWPIRSQGFGLHLSRAFWLLTGKSATAKIISEASATLTARAQFDGPEIAMHTRVATIGDTIYLDLCDRHWRAIKITREGWTIVRNPPVRFRRARGMLALPDPVPNGNWEALRPFVNVPEDHAWLLLRAWVIACVREKCPFPVLVLCGAQGNAKSTTARVLKSIIDPNEANLRAAPRNEHDLVIGASNGWVIALDNMSNIRSWLSDALCHMSTGGGFATRELYSDRNESIFDAQRPIIIDGIEELVDCPDLLDRSVALALPKLQMLKSEHEFWSDFQAAHPKILGVVLDTVVCALKRRFEVVLPRMPRMADFAIWATAAEPKLGVEDGEFLCAYETNRQLGTESLLELTPIAEGIRTMLEQMPAANGSVHWSGTATQLLDLLNRNVGHSIRKEEGWPRSSRALSGQLRRVAPSLEVVGVRIRFERPAGGDRTRMINLKFDRSNVGTTGDDGDDGDDSEGQNQNQDDDAEV